MGGLRLIRINRPFSSCRLRRIGWIIRQRRETVTVYICICNALTDRQVRQAAADTGTTKSSEIYAACGCRAQCGQCARTLVSLLRGEAGPIAQQQA